MKTSRALKASRSLREGFAKASRRLQPYPRRLLEGFAKAPRAPPFGNDSSDNDKPPGDDEKTQGEQVVLIAAERILMIIHKISPKRFDIFFPTEGCSEKV